MTKLDTDEVIRITAGKLKRNYKGYKGTFAALVYNCVQKRALPGFCYEEGLVAGAKRDESNLSVTFSGNRSEKDIMEMMDVALRNMSAFPAEGGRARFSINVLREKKTKD